MTDTHERRVPWFLWPFYAIWRLLTFVLNATGRLLCGILAGRYGDPAWRWILRLVRL